jgi:dynein heavy chain
LLKVLSDTLTNLHAAGIEHPFYQPCHYYVLNPKSITMEELYGGINKLTLEWSDGLMAITIRKCVTVCIKNVDNAFQYRFMINII